MNKSIRALLLQLGETLVNYVYINVDGSVKKAWIADSYPYTLIGEDIDQIFTEDCRTWRIKGFVAFGGTTTLVTDNGDFSVPAYLMPDMGNLVIIGTLAVQFRNAQVGSNALRKSDSPLDVVLDDGSP